jgi:NitT/TauT family transport system substrate-binding protein
MRNRLLIAIVSSTVLFSGLACGERHPPTASKSKASVRLKWLHQAQFAGFYVAHEKQFYHDAGIEAEIQPGGVDFPAIQMVASGSADFGVTGADQIILAREKGIPVVAITVIYRESPFCYFTLKTSPIRRVEDFPGHRIGVKLGGNEELTYRAMVKRAKITPTAITEVPVKYDMTPLFTGVVEAWPGYSINEPLVAEEQGHPVHYIWPRQYGVSLYADTLFTTEELIKRDPDFVRRFVQATLRGWEDAVAHPDDAVKSTLKYDDKLSPTHELAMMKASIPLLKPDSAAIGTMTATKWSELQQLLLDGHFLQKPVDINRAFTNEFIGH